MSKRDSLNLPDEGLEGDFVEEEGIEADFYLVHPSESVCTSGRAPTDKPEDLDSDDASIVSNWDGTKWVCRPYRRELISSSILKANREGEKGHVAVLNLLKKSGIRVYVVDSAVSSTVAEIMQSIRSVIQHVKKIDRARATFNPHDAQRCLLYKDGEGRFFNLTLADHTTGPAGTFKDYLSSFSGVQAMSILTVLCRSFACAVEGNVIEESFKPAYLGLLLGTVFIEEISYVWINVAMLVRGVPSISAYTISTKVGTDWMRKIMVFVLSLAGASTGALQRVLTLFGVTMACSVVLANLGSRSWLFLRWKPLSLGGPVEPVIAFFAAIAAGIVVPYMGHRKVEAGGKVAILSVLKSALIVAIVFVISDYDGIQRILVVGSETCKQDFVNISVGSWWTISLLICLVFALKTEPPNEYPDEEEPLLEEVQASPVGFKVPTLPDFPVDPTSEKQKLIECCNVYVEFIVSVVVALVVGGGIIYLAFTDVDENLSDEVDQTVQDLFRTL